MIFFAFLDADDKWMPKHLESIIRLIEKYPEAGLFSTAYKIQNNNGKTEWADLKNIRNPPWEGLIPDYFKSVALGHHSVNASTSVILKKIFLEMEGFIDGYWWGEDIELFLKNCDKISSRIQLGIWSNISLVRIKSCREQEHTSGIC